MQEIDEWRNILENGRTLIELSEMGMPTFVARDEPFKNTVSHTSLLHNRRT